MSCNCKNCAISRNNVCGRVRAFMHVALGTEAAPKVQFSPYFVVILCVTQLQLFHGNVLLPVPGHIYTLHSPALSSLCCGEKESLALACSREDAALTPHAIPWQRVCLRFTRVFSSGSSFRTESEYAVVTEDVRPPNSTWKGANHHAEKKTYSLQRTQNPR